MIDFNRNINSQKKVTNDDIYTLLTDSMSCKHLLWLLPKVFEKRVSQRSSIDILRQYRESKLLKPCNVSQRNLIRLDTVFYNYLPSDFYGIELSPVNPLGLNNILARINQKNILSAIRTTEVVADPTIALAIESAHRRSVLLESNPKDATTVKLSTSHRSLRLQSFDKIPGFTTHFKCFSLCTAGRGNKLFNFEIQNFKEHISFYLSIIQKLKNNGFYIDDIVVSISDIRIIERIMNYYNLERLYIIKHTQDQTFDVFKKYDIGLPNYFDDTKILLPFTEKYGLHDAINLLMIFEKKLYTELKKEYKNITFNFDLHRIAGMRYYDHVCFKISAKNSLGNRYPLVDGGISSWTKKILHNNKERLLTSGFGTELFYRMFSS